MEMRKGKEIGEENEAEKKHQMVRKDAAKSVWSLYGAAMGNRTVKGGEEGREEVRKVLQSTIIHLARLDACIMTFLKCMLSDEALRGQRQKNMWTIFQTFLSFAMGQLAEEM